MRPTLSSAALLSLTACSGTPPPETGGSDTALDPGPSPYTLDGVLRPGDAQALGTHNSTHIEPNDPVHPSHEYTHAPLTAQLEEQGVRAFELDVHLHRDLGWQVFHLPGVDAESTCLQLDDCLGELRAWSQRNPWHLPLMIWVEPKDDDLDDLFAELLRFDDRHDELDAALLDGLGEGRIFSPDELRGDHATLPDALAAEGWPTLGELRGKVVISMLDSSHHRDAYLAGRPALEGRAMFVNADSPDDAFAATFKINDAEGEAERVTALARAGFLITSNVRDGPEHDEATGQAHLAASLAAGAHFLMSDRPAPVDGWSTAIPGGQPARCNPVAAPPECTPAEVEALP